MHVVFLVSARVWFCFSFFVAPVNFLVSQWLPRMSVIFSCLTPPQCAALESQGLPLREGSLRSWFSLHVFFVSFCDIFLHYSGAFLLSLAKVALSTQSQAGSCFTGSKTSFSTIFHSFVLQVEPGLMNKTLAQDAGLFFDVTS